MNVPLSYEYEYQYQIYVASKRKVRRWPGILVVLVYGGALIFTSITENRGWYGIFPALLFGVAITLYLFLGERIRQYFYRPRMKKALRKAYEDMEGTQLTLIANDDHIFVKEKGRETQIRPDQFKALTEVDHYYFLELKAEGAYIIPKSFNPDLAGFVEKVRMIQIPLIAENWPSKGTALLHQE